MRNCVGLMAAVTVSLLLTACDRKAENTDGGGGGSPRGIVGTWTLDTETMKAQRIEGAKKSGGTIDPQTLGEIERDLAKTQIELEISENQTWTGNIREGERTLTASGTWALRDGKFSMKTTQENGAKKDDGRENELLLTDGKLQMLDGEAVEFTFRRKSNESTGTFSTATREAVVGRWMVDLDAMKNDRIERRRRTGVEVSPEMIAEIEKSLENLQFDLDVNADRTWTVTGMQGDRPKSAKGTWSFADGRYSMLTTERDGEKRETPLENALTLAGGKLNIMEGDRVEIVFKRKS